MTEQEIQRIIASCDHTLLAVDASWDQIRTICDDAVHYGTASICIPPSYVKRAAEYLQGRIPVCTVIGFPNGYSTAQVKVFEAQQAIADGASEIDMVINLGWVRDGLYEQILDEIGQVRAASEGAVLKVIIETCLLTAEEKIRLCDIVTRSGADFIKTSTGFSSGGATFEDVALMKAHIGPNVRIKAAGGIATLEDAQRFLELGASRLGTSRVIRLVREMI